MPCKKFPSQPLGHDEDYQHFPLPENDNEDEGTRLFPNRSEYPNFKLESSFFVLLRNLRIIILMTYNSYGDVV